MPNRQFFELILVTLIEGIS